ncbi:MAG: hypothetical protein D6679_10910 [Candidatus Hydrogenedentota bacterium]|nr:MAG: hypothetical protein D6679_10910 [Candidatus Hydrogenedentota bacterium]
MKRRRPLRERGGKINLIPGGAGILLSLLLLSACGGNRTPLSNADKVSESPASSKGVSKRSVKSTELDPYTQLIVRFTKGFRLPKPKFSLFDSGSEEIIDYKKYGRFHGVGTNEFRYEITDYEGLRKAVGEGIPPNEDGVKNDPAYREMAEKNLLGVTHWDAFKTGDPHRAFFIWATAPEDPGVRSYFIAEALERGGLIRQAVRAYYASIVQFPRTAVWSASGDFVWYTAPVAMAAIRRLCNDYPEMGLEYKGGEITIENGHDVDLDNDIIKVDPGKIVKRDPTKRFRPIDLTSRKIVERRGEGTVQLIRYDNGHWRMLVDGKPFVVRGVTYAPTKVGLGPFTDPRFASDWMFRDENKNGRIDAPYDAWVDKNGNGEQDEGEEAVGDFQLMKEMGINAIRLYAGNKPGEPGYDSSDINAPLLRELYEKFGIRVIMGDFLGAYTVGSGATWEEGTDYTNPQHLANMKRTVREKVEALKDEPFLLMWLLGNENNMPMTEAHTNATRTNAGAYPEAYARFVNEVAEMIHELDPNHPVAIGNLETYLTKEYNRFSPEIDVFGVNAYRGGKGFGDLFREIQRSFDRPVLVTEYGCDAYFEGRGEDQVGQASYHEYALRDIVLNQAAGPRAGNSIGGVIFEWLDEWWKNTKGGVEPGIVHDTHSEAAMPFPDGLAHEEWFGIVGQGSGKHSPFERRLRKAYFMYRSYWGT